MDKKKTKLKKIKDKTGDQVQKLNSKLKTESVTI